MHKDPILKEMSAEYFNRISGHNYSYNFDWLTRPIIQFPQDIVAFQEIVWAVKPDLIIELGIARGGSVILSASLLALLDLCENGNVSLAPKRSNPRRVLGVDIDIRDHNRKSLEDHPLYPRLTLIEGSSIDQKIIQKVKDEVKGHKKILVCLDSNHTHNHVLAELEAYAPLVSIDSYCLVWDTVIANMPESMFQSRPWGKNNNPKTAVTEYLSRLDIEGRIGIDNMPLKFKNENIFEKKLLLTVAPNGFLKRI